MYLIIQNINTFIHKQDLGNTYQSNTAINHTWSWNPPKRRVAKTKCQVLSCCGSDNREEDVLSLLAPTLVMITGRRVLPVWSLHHYGYKGVPSFCSTTGYCTGGVSSKSLIPSLSTSHLLRCVENTVTVFFQPGRGECGQAVSPLPQGIGCTEKN